MTPQDYILQVCNKSGIMLEDLCSSIRTNEMIEVRTFIICVLRAKFRLSYSAIGKLLNRDHTSIINLYKKYSQKIKTGKVEIMKIEIPKIRRTEIEVPKKTRAEIKAEKIAERQKKIEEENKKIMDNLWQFSAKLMGGSENKKFEQLWARLSQDKYAIDLTTRGGAIRELALRNYIKLLNN